jgi:sec-independent protein translocase protein TatC
MADEEAREQTLIEHLIELRSRLLKAIAALAVGALAMLPFSGLLYTHLAGPLLAQLPQGTTMIATGVAAPVMAPFKLALIVGMFLAAPVVLYQAWAFIAPGLYRHERALALPLLASSVALFYVGAAFAYFLVFPTLFRFFVGAAPQGVQVMTDISAYLDFVLKMFLGFGAAFEVPVVTTLLVLSGMVTPRQLRQARPYVIVGAFVVGMVLTPPDILSQVMLAVPICVLYEIGVWCAAPLRARARRLEEGGRLSAEGPPR